jgi:formylglycine-generating enzyme required for sulfatase activity
MNKTVNLKFFFILIFSLGTFSLFSVDLPLEKNISFTSELGTISFKMVLVPSGTFTMGAVSDEDAEDDEYPPHKVMLKTPYYIGVTEVTQKEWEAVMGYNPSYFYLGKKDKISENRPVEQVSWYEIARFMNKLSRKMGYQECYSDDGKKIYYDRVGFRLPTEAEWEWACYGGKKQKFVCGEDSANLKKYAFYDMFMTGETKVVAQKHPNGFGLFDMEGNVFEMCNDWYGNYLSNEVINPIGPASGNKKVIRGGGFGSPDYDLRCTNRGKADPDGNFSDVGFRIVLPVLNYNKPVKKEENK